jgi:pimeloyl-ACP methyl ester carboxylesterase
MGNSQSQNLSESSSTDHPTDHPSVFVPEDNITTPPPLHPALLSQSIIPVSPLIATSATTRPVPPPVPPRLPTTSTTPSTVSESRPTTPSTRQPIVSESRPIGFLENIRQGYESIILALVRPTRAIYTERDLGPITFSASNGKIVTRYDFLIKNRRKQNLVCSHWRFESTSSENCVIYCHGNSSCRLSAIGDCLFPSLNSGASVLAFDFSGSGASDGEYISLGVNESNDIEDIIVHLRRENIASRIILWGRSMGATSCLLYASRDHTLAGVIADSPFCDLNRLCYELVEVGSASMQVNITLMQMLFSLVIRLVRSSTKDKTGVDIFDTKFRAIDSVKASVIPVFFIAGDMDRLISYKHTLDLFENYGTSNTADGGIVKFKHIVEGGDHNEPRPEAFVKQAQVFVEAVFNDRRPPANLVSSDVGSKATLVNELEVDMERDLQMAIERSLKS